MPTPPNDDNHVNDLMFCIDEAADFLRLLDRHHALLATPRHRTRQASRSAATSATGAANSSAGSPNKPTTPNPHSRTHLPPSVAVVPADHPEPSGRTVPPQGASCLAHSTAETFGVRSRMPSDLPKHHPPDNLPPPVTASGGRKSVIIPGHACRRGTTPRTNGHHQQPPDPAGTHHQEAHDEHRTPHRPARQHPCERRAAHHARGRQRRPRPPRHPALLAPPRHRTPRLPHRPQRPLLAHRSPHLARTAKQPPTDHRADARVGLATREEHERLASIREAISRDVRTSCGSANTSRASRKPLGRFVRIRMPPNYPVNGAGADGK